MRVLESRDWIEIPQRDRFHSGRLIIASISLPRSVEHVLAKTFCPNPVTISSKIDNPIDFLKFRSTEFAYNNNQPSSINTIIVQINSLKKLSLKIAGIFLLLNLNQQKAHQR
jgi:hypothetical protein